MLRRTSQFGLDHPQVAVFDSKKFAKGKETTNLVGRIAQMSEQEIEDLIETPEWLWHQHFSGIGIPAADAHWRPWERRVRNREGKMGRGRDGA